MQQQLNTAVFHIDTTGNVCLFFFFFLVYFLGDLARSGPSKLSTFHLIELHPYLVAVRSHSTPFAGLVETVPAGPSAFLCDLQLTNRFN